MQENNLLTDQYLSSHHKCREELEIPIFQKNSVKTLAAVCPPGWLQIHSLFKYDDERGRKWNDNDEEAMLMMTTLVMTMFTAGGGSK